MGRIFLPGVCLLGGTLLTGAVISVPAAAMCSAEILGAVPGPTVPPTASKAVSYTHLTLPTNSRV